jgi:hypothetical protein
LLLRDLRPDAPDAYNGSTNPAQREWAIVTAEGQTCVQPGHSLEDALKAFRKATSNPLKVLCVVATDRLLHKPETSAAFVVGIFSNAGAAAA